MQLISHLLQNSSAFTTKDPIVIDGSSLNSFETKWIFRKMIYYLSQIEYGRIEIFCPAVRALGADVSGLPVPVHYGLEDGGKGGNADTGADQHSMLGPEDLAGRCAKWPIDVNLIKN